MWPESTFQISAERAGTNVLFQSMISALVGERFNCGTPNWLRGRQHGSAFFGSL
jgi:hypothetical protein